MDAKEETTPGATPASDMSAPPPTDTAAPPSGSSPVTSEGTAADAVTTAAEGPLEAEWFDENDSAIGVMSDEQVSTRSLWSSLREVHMINGRGYHRDENYWLPVDEEESERLDFQNHQLFLTFEGRRQFAPNAEKANRVLDVGTGTGVWAIEFAEEHPAAEVVGVDIAPIQPDYVPCNLRFEVDDVESPWTWTRKFDLVFIRMLAGSIANWDALYQQAYDKLEPGGWIELQDPGFPVMCDDGTLKPDSALVKYDERICKAAENFGRPMDVGSKHADRLVASGFMNVERRTYKWPINTWPKDPKHKAVGLWTFANIEGNLEAISMALMTRGLGMTSEQVRMFLVDVRRDLRDRRIHAYWPVYVTTGQKPPQ